MDADDEEATDSEEEMSAAQRAAAVSAARREAGRRGGGSNLWQPGRAYLGITRAQALCICRAIKRELTPDPDGFVPLKSFLQLRGPKSAYTEPEKWVDRLTEAWGVSSDGRTLRKRKRVGGMRGWDVAHPDTGATGVHLVHLDRGLKKLRWEFELD